MGHYTEAWYFATIARWHSVRNVLFNFSVFHQTYPALCLLRSFLDFRICMNPKDNRFYFAHGLFCEEISKALKCIGSFLNEHPNEFVIIDCQHFYNFSNGDYGRLERILLNTFEQILYQPKDGSIQELSLSMAHSVQKQMVIIYRYSFVPNQFWPSNCWPTPWPNQISISKLERSLELSLSYRSPDIGYVTQCVLTPPPKFIVPR